MNQFNNKVAIITGGGQGIGRAAVFLCSGESTFITGQNLTIDGGMTVKMIYEE